LVSLRCKGTATFQDGAGNYEGDYSHESGNDVYKPSETVLLKMAVYGIYLIKKELSRDKYMLHSLKIWQISKALS